MIITNNNNNDSNNDIENNNNANLILKIQPLGRCALLLNNDIDRYNRIMEIIMVMVIQITIMAIIIMTTVMVRAFTNKKKR